LINSDGPRNITQVAQYWLVPGVGLKCDLQKKHCFVLQ